MIDLYKKLLATTQSMCEACKNENWPSVATIEQQRQKLMKLIKESDTNEAECYATIKAIIECNNAIESMLKQYKEKQVNTLGSLRNAQKNHSAYQSTKRL